jgi:pilus assembly protein Flp/PilA
MEIFMNTMIRLFKSEEGATAIEYALIAALIAIAAIVAMGTVGTQVTASFNKIGNQLSTSNAAR